MFFANIFIQIKRIWEYLVYPSKYYAKKYARRYVDELADDVVKAYVEFYKNRDSQLFEK